MHSLDGFGHLHLALEARAIGDGDGHAAQIALHLGAPCDLELLVRGDIAFDFAGDEHHASTDIALPAGAGAQQQCAGEVAVSLHRAVNGVDVLAREGAGELRLGAEEGAEVLYLVDTAAAFLAEPRFLFHAASPSRCAACANKSYPLYPIAASVSQARAPRSALPPPRARARDLGKSYRCRSAPARPPPQSWRRHRHRRRCRPRQRWARSPRAR